MKYIPQNLTPGENEAEEQSMSATLRSSLDRTGDFGGRQPAPQAPTTTPVQYITYNITVNQTAPSASAYQPTYRGTAAFTREAATARSLRELLSQLGASLDDPCNFEQTRAAFVSVLRDLGARKQAREPHFTDVLTMLEVGFACTDASDLSAESISVLEEVVSALAHELTADDVRHFRKRFRESGIDILRPLDPAADVSKLIKEFFT